MIKTSGVSIALLAVAALVTLLAMAVHGATESEPNNDYAHANSLAEGQTSGAVGPMGMDMVDYFTFTAGQGTIIKINGTGGCSIKLLDEAYTAVLTLSALITKEYHTAHETPSSTVWFVQVAMMIPTMRVPYNLNLDLALQDDMGSGGDAPADLASALSLDPPNSLVGDGVLADLDTRDCFKFTAGAGDVINMSFTSDSSVDLNFTILDATQVLVLKLGSRGGTAASDLFYTALETPDSNWYVLIEMGSKRGNYSIWIRLDSQTDGGTQGDAPATPQNGKSVTGPMMTGLLCDLDMADAYRIAVDPSDTLVLKLTNNGVGTLLLVLMDALLQERLRFEVPGGGVLERSALVQSNSSGGSIWSFVVSAGDGNMSLYKVESRIDDLSPPSITHTAPEILWTGEAKKLEATVTDNSEVTAVKLFYRVRGVTAFTELAMVKEHGNLWNATVPGAAVTSAGLEYYIWATDAASNSATFPAGGSSDPVVITNVRTPDTSPPVIAHTPPAPWVQGSSMSIVATITDNNDVVSAELYYRKTGAGCFTMVVMVEGPANVWTAQVPGTVVTTDGVEYYLWTTDGVNQVWLPTDGAANPFKITDIQGPDTVPPVISHTKPTPWNAGSPRDIVATITDAKGVTSAKLFFRKKGETTYAELAMVKGAGDTWTAAVPGTTVTATGVEYYIWATDGANEATFPTDGAAHPIAVTDIGMPDTQAPDIVHSVPTAWARGAAKTVTATITDNTAVVESKLFLRKIGETDYTEVAMTKGTGDKWSAEVPGSAVTTAGVEYYIWATDGVNEAMFPTAGPTGPISVTEIVEPDTVSPSILHNVPTGWTAGTPKTITATITDQVDVASAKLFYRVKGTTSFTEASMAEGASNVWSAEIDGEAITAAGVEYYLWASDGQNVVTYPAGAPGTPISITDVSPQDITGPTIDHTAPKELKEGQAIVIEASVADDSGVGSVTLYYRAGGSGAFGSIPMVKTGNKWYATIPKGDVKKGTVDYYIVAEDTLGNIAKEGDASVPLYASIAGEGKEGGGGVGLMLWAVVLVIVIVVVVVVFILSKRRSVTPAVTPAPTVGAQVTPVAPPAQPAAFPLTPSAPTAPPAVAAPVGATGTFAVVTAQTYCSACGGVVELGTNAYRCGCGSVLHERCAGQLRMCPTCKTAIRFP